MTALFIVLGFLFWLFLLLLCLGLAQTAARNDVARSRAVAGWLRYRRRGRRAA
jgi:hypothetical protein